MIFFWNNFILHAEHKNGFHFHTFLLFHVSLFPTKSMKVKIHFMQSKNQLLIYIFFFLSVRSTFSIKILSCSSSCQYRVSSFFLIQVKVYRWIFPLSHATVWIALNRRDWGYGGEGWGSGTEMACRRKKCCLVKTINVKKFGWIKPTIIKNFFHNFKQFLFF